ncbi:Adenosylcobinamide-phosphate guanylyltransferase [Thioalkalivibrio nitratireducens DSM 14787]|uniref:Bifunctional adenosylcobalamin biosynthesis protein n=1 Tax=Thioalkalivibrio nitratireducens (strain DSM 14787 / UNIQEM 213 / ALEN2) TaxID=1255043 RepID=L0E1E6_THIND|nr:bifunctional adenosylcobinamide kinase/adenosylcobinamide-phosphate guanylyltransferase [Thioalkalivibrio nitratireducens]AGA35123.1 Adenosylcobinamide-phosphate guanylyltransferase [Thioalkalivibrio nitratireducens DSM 14787]
MRTLVLGGARSGKSALAERIAADSGLPVTVIVTAEIHDPEMAERVARHRADRPGHWQTIEAPRALAAALEAHAREDRLLVIDCLTLWLSNLMLDHDTRRVDVERDALLAVLTDLPGRIVFVANEVGLGIVPEHPLARQFRDQAGRLNQALAARCDEVLFVAAGLSLTLKGQGAGS